MKARQKAFRLDASRSRWRPKSHPCEVIEGQAPSGTASSSFAVALGMARWGILPSSKHLMTGAVLQAVAFSLSFKMLSGQYFEDFQESTCIYLQIAGFLLELSKSILY
jgi:hypothetical protein